MRISIIAVGRQKRGPMQELFGDYQRRLPWEVSVVEVETKKSLSGDALKAEEARLIAEKLPNGALIVTLDERGKALKSTDFADRFRGWQESGRGQIAFVIGGADGLDRSLVSRADLSLAFGPQTWPHMLVRVMLIEQIYRAERILAGHPYHRE